MFFFIRATRKLVWNFRTFESVGDNGLLLLLQVTFTCSGASRRVNRFMLRNAVSWPLCIGHANEYTLLFELS